MNAEPGRPLTDDELHRMAGTDPEPDPKRLRTLSIHVVEPKQWPPWDVIEARADGVRFVRYVPAKPPPFSRLIGRLVSWYWNR